MSQHQIEAALSAYAASTNLAELWQRYAVVEQIMNAEAANGRFESSAAVRAEMNRISREVGGRIQAEADAISPYSKANWAKAKASRNSPATQTEAA